MVHRSTLISFCAALLCTGSTATAADQSTTSGSGSTRSSNLRKPSKVLEPTATASDNAPRSSSRLGESLAESDKLAELSSSIAAFSAAYQQVIDAVETMQTSNNNSVELMNEDFSKCHNMEHFRCDTTNNVHGRDGVILLAHPNDYIATNNILPADGSTFSTFIVTFSFRTTEMSNGDKFCIDFSTNHGSSWEDEECYEYGVDFENGFWYDDVGVQFDTEDIEGLDNGDSLSLRLIGSGKDGHVMFDGMRVVASM